MLSSKGVVTDAGEIHSSPRVIRLESSAGTTARR